MSRLSRRSLLAGAAGASALAVLNRPSRHALAQATTYKIITFGAVREAVQIAYSWGVSPDAGEIKGIHSGGTAFGRVAASDKKFTPTLFHPDGSLTRLKSGEFGGSVHAINSSGHAVGAAYDFAGGEPTDRAEHYGSRPALWIDGELTRLPMPDKTQEGIGTGGYAAAISDTGAIFGYANGQDVLWIDGEPQFLPGNSEHGSLSYRGLTPDGTLISEASTYSAEANAWAVRRGTMRDGVFTPFDLPEDVELLSGPTLVNSANDVLYGLIGDDFMLRKTAIVASDGQVQLTDFGDAGLDFFPVGFNAGHEIIGDWQGDYRNYPAALMRGEELIYLETLLPDNDFWPIDIKGISDAGIIAAEGEDRNRDFHVLLIVPV